MKISAPTITEQNDRVTYSVDITRDNGNVEVLFFSIEAAFRDLISDRADAALLSLLIPAMDHGENIEIIGTITDEFLYRINTEYQKILCSAMPNLKLISIHANRKAPPASPASGVATGFSGGVDSYTVIADHYLAQDTPKSLRLTHLLHNDVGAHRPSASSLFLKRSAKAKKIAGKLGLPLIIVESNMDDFYPSHLFFQQTHTPRNAAVALLLQNGIGTFLYASAVQYQSARVGSTEAIAETDAIALPVLSNKGLELRSSGSQYTRVAKTLRVTEVPQSYSTLDVCTSPSGNPNCSVCKKCLRTELTLEIAGKLDLYAAVFDVSKYRSERSRYLPKVLTSNEALLEEVRSFAQQEGFRFPLWAYTVAPMSEAKTRLTKKLKPYLRRARRASHTRKAR